MNEIAVCIRYRKFESIPLRQAVCDVANSPTATSEIAARAQVSRHLKGTGAKAD